MSLRGMVKVGLLRLIQRIAEMDEARSTLGEMLTGQLAWQPIARLSHRAMQSPYPDLGADLSNQQRRQDVVFVTGRFRSGSTLLWRLFRESEDTTAYYEPFNERRWFDVHTRGDWVDETHRNVENYWKEYDGLAELADYYSDDWIQKNLYMDEMFWAPLMKQYVETLIERARARPVLQFNRIDFRLPWFRQHFPVAKIVHIYRHPRDQWCSSLGGVRSVPREVTVGDFSHYDHYYLRMWARDLKSHFPFLDEKQVKHPYELFYYIWKLSFVFGVSYADHSLSFERLIQDPRKTLLELFGSLQLRAPDITRLTQLFHPPPIGKWDSYADDGWFRERESHCEAVLHAFLEQIARVTACPEPPHNQ